MNILFVLEYYPPHIGGIQMVFKNIAERLVDRGHTVSVVTARTGNTQSREERNGVDVHRALVMDPFDRYTFTITGLPKAIGQAQNVDVIHTSTWTGAVPAWITKKITRTPGVMTIHEVFSTKWTASDLDFISKRLYSLLEQGLYRLPFDRYTVVSEYTERQLINQGKDTEDIEVIYNGVDDELFDPERVDPTWMKSELGLEDRFVYTYFGRPGPFKGVEYLVRAAPSIRKKIDNATLLLILSHQPQNRYQAIMEKIIELDLEDHVRVIDPVDRAILPQYIGGSDCVVVPSISEGFGFTAAEACALEVPVVATTAGSLPEVVSGEHRLVEPASPQAIAEGVLDIYYNKYNISKKRTFDWERAVDEYLDVYSSIT